MRVANDPRYLELVAKLRRARKARGLTQAQLASLLARPQPYVSKIETCERRIDLIETAEWCVHLAVRLDDLLPNRLKLAIEANAEVKVDDR